METFIKEFTRHISAETCDGIIQLFNAAHKRKLTHPGKTGRTVDKQRKDSSDLSATMISTPLKKKYDPFLADYFDRLNQAFVAYTDQFPILRYPKSWAMGVYDFNIQRYYPGGQAYHAWHYETAHPEVMDRVLTWMTYLNTVEKGGETEFQYQQMKVSPEQGKTLIWPGGFTHLHRGLPTPEETKFIITGWFSFAPAK